VLEDKVSDARTQAATGCEVTTTEQLHKVNLTLGQRKYYVAQDPFQYVSSAAGGSGMSTLTTPYATQGSPVLLPVGLPAVLRWRCPCAVDPGSSG
jgi:hypothetical protein